MGLGRSVLFSITGALLMSFMLSTNMTWTSSVIPKLMNPESSPFGRAISNNEAGWITSIMGLGTIPGTYIFMFLAEKWGKKLTLLSSGVPCLISNVIIYYAKSVELYILARFIIGLSMGVLFLFPVYIIELTSKNSRIMVGTMCTCAACSGFLFSNAVGPFVDISTFSFILSIIVAIYLVYFAIFGEEVPQYYLEKNQDNLARNLLETLTGGYEDIDEQFDVIINDYKKEVFRDVLLSKAVIKALIIGVSLLIFSQLSGMAIIMCFGQQLIQDINPELSPEISVIFLTIIIFLSSLLAPLFCVRFPKRTLLIVSGMFMCLSEIVLGIYSYCKYNNYNLPKSLSCLPIICLTIFITANNIGLGPLSFLILAEIIPNRVKTVASSIAGLLVGLIAFLTTKFYMQIVDVIGIHGYFWLCSVFCLLSSIFTKFYVIETKDKSLEEIQHELSL